MNADPMEVLRQWALQTVTYTMTVENAARSGITREVVEQTAIPAWHISNQFFTESTAACTCVSDYRTRTTRKPKALLRSSRGAKWR